MGIKNKIDIIGAYGESNFGDDLLMIVFENYFTKEFPNFKLNFIGEKNNYVKNILVKGSYNSKIQKNDFVVFGGGTQFFSFNASSKLSTKQKILLSIKNPKLVFNKIFNKKNDILFNPTAFLGIGLGPFYNNEISIERTKTKLQNSFFVGVRDFVSKDYCNQWNVDCVLGADVVFSSYFNNILELEKKTNSKKRIGIIVRDWNWEENGEKYIENLLLFYNQNKNDDSIEYKFIIFAPYKDKNWMHLLKNEDFLIWDPTLYEVENFIDELNCFDGFISARYHGAIIGALLGKPVICIEVEQKLNILTKQISKMKLWEFPFVINDLEKKINELEYNICYEKDLNVLKADADNMLKSFKEKIKYGKNS